MAERIAFLIGNQVFRQDSGLQSLRGPQNDVVALSRILGDPERGGFAVQRFLDQPHHEILQEIEDTLGKAGRGDLVLIYYSGHGKLDRNGSVCLATANTRETALQTTSIPARHITNLVDQSDCDQVVLVLDCCYSGAVEGLRGDLSSELTAVGDASGFYILTATTAQQTARETEPAGGGEVMGRFTAALVDAIENGTADVGRKGRILLSDLRACLVQTVIGQTPQFSARRATGDPLISLSPRTAEPLLDPKVVADLAAESWHHRLGAVVYLIGKMREGKRLVRRAAQERLQQHLASERDVEVRQRVEEGLREEAKRKGDGGQSAAYQPGPEQHQVEAGQELRVFTGHSGAICSAALSPDGRSILTMSFDCTARLWDAEGGQQLLTFIGKKPNWFFRALAVVDCTAAFSPDGRCIVTACGARAAELWDSSGQQIRIFTGHSGREVRSAAFDPDGRRVVTASDSTATLWDVETGQHLGSLAGHTELVTSAAFSPDGRRIVTASHDKTVRLWEWEIGQQVRVFGHTCWARMAQFSPDGRHIVTVSQEDKARLWETENGRQMWAFGHSSWINSAAFSPDGRRIVTASDDKTAKLWEAKTGRLLQTFIGHAGRVVSAAFSPDGRRIVTASRDKTVRLWAVPPPGRTVTT